MGFAATATRGFGRVGSNGGAGMKPPVIAAREPIFIGIDVQANGKLCVALWRGDERNAGYRPAFKAEVLSRFLPQAIDEAIAFAQEEAAQASSGGSLEGS